MKKDNDLIQVLVIKTKEAPYVDNIKNNLETFQSLVGGDIEVITNRKDNTLLICKENGKLDNSPYNRPLKVDGKVVDIICGDFLLVGSLEDEFCSLTDEKCEEYKKEYDLIKSFREIHNYIVKELNLPKYEIKKSQDNSFDESYEEGMDML